MSSHGIVGSRETLEADMPKPTAVEVRLDFPIGVIPGALLQIVSRCVQPHPGTLEMLIGLAPQTPGFVRSSENDGKTLLAVHFGAFR